MRLGYILLIFLLLFTPNVVSATNTEDLLKTLSQAIEESELYVSKKNERIENLRKRLKEDPSVEEQFRIYDKLYVEFQSYQYDSAFAYAQKLRETANTLQDPALITYSKLELSFTLLSSGMFKEALDSLNVIEVAKVPDTLKADYYELLSLAYYDLSVYNGDTHYASLNLATGNKYMDSAIAWSDTNSIQFYHLRGVKHLKEKQYEKAKNDFQLILDRFEPTLHQYAIVASSLASVYKETGKIDTATNLMAHAAIADIQSSTKEALALINLAELLYANGRVELAYDYIKQALEDADFYGARQRKNQASAILPIIEGAQLAKVERQKSRVMTFAIAVSFLSLIVVVFTFVIFRQFRQLRQAKQTVTEANHKLRQANDMLQESNEKLLEANKIKEEYIGHSFNLYTEHLDKVKKLKTNIHRKLMDRKYDEINHVMDSFNLKKEREALYLSFDKIFLKLFPDFIEIYNSFFKEEDQYIRKEDQLLNIELRIFALIRIGIHDHEQIAKILEYSVRTIYSYKTKAKSRSLLVNEEFEQRIMAIRTF